jgi:hypothetical protein
MTSIINRGTGAGGANTNASGKPFEEKVSNKERLLTKEFIQKSIPGRKGKYDYFIVNPTNTIVYVKQSGLNSYLSYFFGKSISKKPDEAYIVHKDDEYVLKILEIKNQNMPGSVIEKLQTAYYKRYMYERCLNMKVEYAYCLSNYLKREYLKDDEESKTLRTFNHEKGIHVFFGEDDDYFIKIDEWINS